MKNQLLALSFLFSTAASAQVAVQVTLPTITFQAPPTLVVVSPGVQVVEAYGDEVFFVSGAYWVRQGPVWYRTGDYHGGWVVVQTYDVPRVLVQTRPGRYKNYRRSSVGKQPTVHHRPAVAPSNQGHKKGHGKKR